MTWTIVKIVIFGLLLLYIAAILFLYFQQERFIFFPNPLEKEYKFQGFHDFEEVVLAETSTKYWHALHFKKEKPKGIILYLHGNTSDLQQWGVMAKDFQDLEYEVMMLDYPSFGKSRGRLTERQINKMVRKGYDYCRSKFEANDIIILGRSLGTGPATTLATRVASRLLILETPYTSLPDVGARTWKIFPVRYLSKFRFNTLMKIQHTKCPVVIFHGTLDELVPYDMGVQIAAKKGDLITLEGADHNGFSDTELYQKTITKLLQ